MSLVLTSLYFTLHVTVDNADTGYARRAVQAVSTTHPALAMDDSWQRVAISWATAR
jgi:hypothetical protein